MISDPIQTTEPCRFRWNGDDHTNCPRCGGTDIDPIPMAAFYRDADDIVAAGIDADLAAGRCWACRCEHGQPHAPNCPEAESNG